MKTPYQKTTSQRLLSLVMMAAAVFAPRRGLICAANDDDEDVIEAANAGAGEANFELQQSERMFVPYGDYPHAVGLQRFNRDGAEAMAKAFNSIGSKIARFFTKPGRPVYRGHPDVPGRPDSDPSAPALGWITGITADNDGAFFDVKWNEGGKTAIANGEYRFYSPYWNLKKHAGALHPVDLISFGLTNNPRIPVPALANDKARMDKLQADLEAAQTSLGLITAQNDERGQKLTAAENDLTTARADIERLNGELTTLRGQLEQANTQLAEAKTKLTKAENDLTAANTAGAAERKGRIEARLDVLVLGNKLTAAQLTEQLPKLIAIENDELLEAAFTELGKAKLPTGESKTKDLGKKNSDALKIANDQQMQIRNVVATEEAKVSKEFPHLKPGAVYEIAFNRARTANPQLFGNA